MRWSLAIFFAHLWLALYFTRLRIYREVQITDEFLISTETEILRKQDFWKSCSLKNLKHIKKLELAKLCGITIFIYFDEIKMLWK